MVDIAKILYTDENHHLRKRPAPVTSCAGCGDPIDTAVRSGYILIGSRTYHDEVCAKMDRKGCRNCGTAILQIEQGPDYFLAERASGDSPRRVDEDVLKETLALFLGEVEPCTDSVAHLGDVSVVVFGLNDESFKGLSWDHAEEVEDVGP